MNRLIEKSVGRSIPAAPATKTATCVAVHPPAPFPPALISSNNLFGLRT
jgi:hypothetical protein